MANTFFKSFAESDRTTSRTLLHENIPITGTIISGTYNNNNNIKSFSHGMFKSVYDYPYLSSSANHLFDISWGFVSGNNDVTSIGEGLEIVDDVTNQEAKKQNMYAQMAQVLAGFDTSSKVRAFDFDGDYGSTTDTMGVAGFITFSRLLVKDEIKKGSFTITLGTASAYATPFSHTCTLGDYGADTNYKINSPAGEFGLLYTSSASATKGEKPRGLIFYQAGVAVLPIYHKEAFGTGSAEWIRTGGPTKREILRTGSIDQFADGMVRRIQNIQFNNTTELNSTIYFCRASHNEFNYSSNPTYLSDSKVVVKANDMMMPPRSYATTVGLYSADNELLAVAKLSEPLRKDPTNELTLRVRLDY